MAKAIAHITGTALRPGVSRNKRWYKPEHIAGAVASAQQRIGEGAKPMVMLSFHGAEDNSREITAALTSMTLAEDGSAQFGADIIGTEAGRDIAALADSTDGKPALSTVSIRGAWTGKVRRERGPSGELVETADGLELDGIDWTKSPGVDGAEIATFAWAAEGQNETSERVLITESVEVAEMVVESGETAESAPTVPEAVREALALLLPGEAHVFENGVCATCAAVEEKKGGKTPYGDVTYADPGYQSDGVKRYPLDSTAHIRSAWSYINVAKNAAKYTAAQLKRIKGRIKGAMKRLGAKVSAESGGWIVGEPFQVTEAVAEFYGDPERCGSWSISASNGPVNLNLSSWSMDPADLDVILKAAADAACAALKRLDPDMDGDVDVAPGGDTDGDGGHESADEDEDLAEAEDGPDGDPATETIPDAQADGESPAPAGTQEMEDPAMAEETTNEAGGAAPAGLTLEGVTQAFVTALNARDEAKEQRKQAKRDREAREAAEATARKTALTEALAELGIVPAPAAPAATETGDGDGNAPLSEADVAKRVEAGIEEALTEFKQQLLASGAILPSRTGVVIKEHAIPEDEAPTGEDLRAKNDDDLMNYLGGAMAQQADKIRPIG